MFFRPAARSSCRGVEPTDLGPTATDLGDPVRAILHVSLGRDPPDLGGDVLSRVLEGGGDQN